MIVELTKSQCDNLRDFIEIWLFEDVRQDENIDNIAWLHDMTTVWYKLDQLSKTTKAEDDSSAN